MTHVTNTMLSAANKALADQKNVTVDIMVDIDPTNPRSWDNLGTMYITDKHDDNLGDVFIPNFEDEIEDHASIIAYYADKLSVKKSDIIIKDIITINYGDSRGIYLNEHTPQARCQGHIVTTKAQAREAYQVRALTKKHLAAIDAQLEGEAEDYKAYLNGEVYGYDITCKLTGAMVDSQWGFLGSDDPYMNEEIKANIDAWTPPTIYKFKFKPNLMIWSKPI